MPKAQVPRVLTQPPKSRLTKDLGKELPITVNSCQADLCIKRDVASRARMTALSPTFYEAKQGGGWVGVPLGYDINNPLVLKTCPPLKLSDTLSRRKSNLHRAVQTIRAALHSGAGNTTPG